VRVPVEVLLLARASAALAYALQELERPLTVDRRYARGRARAACAALIDAASSLRALEAKRALRG
jgi:hypothetical protein